MFLTTGVLRHGGGAPTGTTKRIEAGGLSISVPARWPRTTVPGRPCLDLTAPGVLVGTFGAVRNCFMRLSPTEPAVTFGFGGPPEPPVPTGEPERRTVNGVAALISIADTSLHGTEHEVMALFPEWNAWLRVELAADRKATVAAASALLDTLRITAARDPSPPPPPVYSFLGHWHVHGALLDIDATQGRLTVECSLPDRPCLETFILTLMLSGDGRRLDAVVTDITWTDPSTGRPVPNPDPSSGGTGIGDTSYFEFVAPHLLKQTSVRTADPTVDEHGNPYWCGEGLDPALSDHCGL